MSRTIAVFGGSFNPPGMHHRAIAELLAQHFDEVIVVPCGPRPDKPITNNVPPVYRAAMADMTFRGMSKVTVDLFDLEASTFSRTHELDERYRGRGRLFHVIGADLLQGAESGECVIHREWARGHEIWQRLSFAVVRRPGYQLDRKALPPHHVLLDITVDGASSAIRGKAFQREDISGLATNEVVAFIERHNLYRGMQPPLRTRLQLSECRPLLVYNERSPRAVERARSLAVDSETDEPNLIVVIGGDGTMLHAIREHWRRRVPFYGINTGHLGFLLNQIGPLERSCTEDLVLEHLPLLYAEVEHVDGTTASSLAFNDAWVERDGGQTAWIEVAVDGQQRLPKLIADGALIATAAGSTSYARAMGATPLPLNTPALLLVGSNVLLPPFFRPAVLSPASVVRLRTLDLTKRPLRGYIDGVDQGRIKSMVARVSNIAAVELAFDPAFDMVEKLAQIQFPLAPGES